MKLNEGNKMVAHDFNKNRLRQLEDLLGLHYEKLHEFEKALAVADGISQRIALRQQMKHDLLPRLSELEREYAALLSETSATDDVNERDAETLVSNLRRAVDERERYQQAGASAEMLQLLEQISAKLDEPGKSATAKLKVVIPIIPALVQYELELDTENFILRAWRSVKTVLLG